jgi:hypothetical protein
MSANNEDKEEQRRAFSFPVLADANCKLCRKDI